MRILYVSKAIAPPFHDGSQVLVREIAEHLDGAQALLMGSRVTSAWTTPPHVQLLPVYPQPGGFAPGLRDHVFALGHLMRERRADLWHTIFAPTPRNSRVFRTLRRLRRVPIVQTIASPPSTFEGAEDLLFGDAIVAQSEWTRRELRSAVPIPRQIELIRPAVPNVVRPAQQAIQAVRTRLELPGQARIVLYAGDLEFSAGASRVADIAAELVRRVPETVLVFACRRKTAAAEQHQRALQRRLDPRHTRFAGELPSLLPLLAASEVLVFPVEQLWAKVDIPVVLLEAAALGVAAVVSDRGPLAEFDALRVDPTRPKALLEACVALLESQAERQTVLARQERQLEREFRAATVAGQYQRLYERLRPQ